MQVKEQKNSRVPALRNRRAKPAGVFRKELDPGFYKSLSSFRRAVQDGSVDVSKACRNMDEYHWSLEHEKHNRKNRRGAPGRHGRLNDRRKGTEMSAKRIYETDEVKAFAKAMSPISRRVIVTPEMKRSMAKTKAEMDKCMADPSFRAELSALDAEYKAQDYAQSIMRTPDFAAAKKFFRKIKGEVRIVFSFNGANSYREEIAFA